MGVIYISLHRLTKDIFLVLFSFGFFSLSLRKTLKYCCSRHLIRINDIICFVSLFFHKFGSRYGASLLVFFLLLTFCLFPFCCFCFCFPCLFCLFCLLSFEFWELFDLFFFFLLFSNWSFSSFISSASTQLIFFVGTIIFHPYIDIYDILIYWWILNVNSKTQTHKQTKYKMFYTELILSLQMIQKIGHTGCQLKHGQSGTAIAHANPNPPIIPNVV